MAEEKYNLQPDSFEPLAQDQEQELDSEKIAAPSLTFSQDAWRRLKKNKGALISLFIVLIMVIVSFGSTPFINHSELVKSNPEYANLPAKIPGVNINGLNGKMKVSGVWTDVYKENGIKDNVHFMLGTDYLGHSLAQRIIYGTKISLTVAIVATLFDLLIGVTYGIVSGWKGGRTDNVMQRIIEIISSIPNLIIVVLMLIIFKPGMTSIILALAISAWTTMARMIRAETLSLKTEEYVLAARTLGESTTKIAWKHLVPNVSSIIIIQTMYTIPTAIFFEAFLSFIGIGISAPQTSLGVLLNDGQKNFQFLPYQMWYPAIVLVILMIAFNLLGDGLRDAFDPRTRR
ncbi:ABC transporter permease [Ligilactobacillus acidipiscis]|jgi:oligopeptide transport system permease protein|uniref:Oligopeptide transport system permease protein OppC (TC 3.A.1.5.1) n=1 Tax=Ligilactobacillus acidipiscis TaxID=89059 RepID=A0A0R2JZE0_9LACO|nr:ABC transporter permease [Ligilactobacillus acidipiscis]KRN80405.1 peptide nickel transport system permease protein [Ligilactobacillus acidipiscis]MCI1924129.1 ABC transporter permease [Ligilactobacillus acidipiscis]SFV41241.1 Oligopeptide transport system permease protein OppC (TC 3.A.1.5.1) [Ligilactobacillus acidipiscis]